MFCWGCFVWFWFLVLGLKSYSEAQYLWCCILMWHVCFSSAYVLPPSTPLFCFSQTTYHILPRPLHLDTFSSQVCGRYLCTLKALLILANVSVLTVLVATKTGIEPRLSFKTSRYSKRASVHGHSVKFRWLTLLLAM